MPFSVYPLIAYFVLVNANALNRSIEFENPVWGLNQWLFAVDGLDGTKRGCQGRCLGPSVRLTLLYILIQDRLLVILEGAKVFDKKGIHPSDYSISFKLADNVPKQGGIFGDCADEDVLSKVKTHEKRMRDAGSISSEELVAWAEEEAGSRLSLDGYIDVGGSSTCCDLVHESVVYDGPSLLHIEKECFANDVVLMLEALLTKIMRLRKGLGKIVSSGANYGKLGSLIGLNEHEGDDDPQITTQVSLTVGSFNNDVKDVE
ncbi:hypothetical protein Tco_0221705 [Tanacetum coccineum]